MIYAQYAVVTFVLGVVAGYLLGKLVSYWPDIKHRIQYKKYRLPCATCNGKGWIRPSNSVLIKEMGGEENLPTFPCSACKGSKFQVHEFRRGEKVEVTEDGRIVSEHTGVR